MQAAVRGHVGVLQVVIYDGRAGVPVLKGFRKLFFRHPATKELYGHVDVGYWPLGASLYPLYFRCNIGVEIFPGNFSAFLRHGNRQEDVQILDDRGISANCILRIDV